MLFNFKVFTLNCWGLAVMSKNRAARISAIANLLAVNDFDVVCLQEVWTDSDYNLIREIVSAVLPYSHYFYSGVTGSGICIFSKHLIEETFFHQWSVNGYIHKFHHGDWWAGKGVGLCRLKVNNNKSESYIVNIYSAHLHAEYNRASDDYQAHRVLQAYDTAQFILLTSNAADLVILAGDLNTEPGDLAYKLILNIPGFTDAYVEADNLPQEQYATCESCKNSYTASSLIDAKLLGKRIDYIMYHSGLKFTTNLKSYSLPLPERVPKQSFSYSDHEAVLIELSLKRNNDSSTDAKKCADDATQQLILEECINLCEEALKSISQTKLMYWFGVSLLIPLIIVAFCMPTIINVTLFNNYTSIIEIIKLILIIFLIFCFLMATMWSKIETHGVKSGKIAMEVSLKKFNRC